MKRLGLSLLKVMKTKKESTNFTSKSTDSTNVLIGPAVMVWFTSS